MDEFIKIWFAPGGLTAFGLVLATLIAGSRGAWFYGATVKDIMKERDEWKAIAVSATTTVKEQADQLGQLTEILQRRRER